MDEVKLNYAMKTFHSHRMDISSYQNQLWVIEGNEEVISTPAYPVVATTNTFSCTNILFYTDRFSYLVHMYPSETVGMNDQFLSRLKTLQSLIEAYQLGEKDTLHILISVGISNAKDSHKDFHDLSFIEEKLSILAQYCASSNVRCTLLPIIQNKLFLFDYRDGTLCLDQCRGISNIKMLEIHEKEITSNIIRR